MHQPGVARDQLPEQLSGVLCRCTGYRNILSAVADVAERFPDGLPGPAGCRGRTLVGRGSQPAPRVTGASRTAASEPVPSGIALREGAPTFRVYLTSTLSPRAAEVWSVLDDPERLAACLPGVELTERLGGNRYRGRIRITLGPVRLSFEGLAHITEHDKQARQLRVTAAGADSGRNQAQADIRLRADPAAGGTELQADAAVYLSGRIAQFGRALAGDLSRRPFHQFVQAIEAAAAGGAPPPAARGRTLRGSPHEASPRAFVASSLAWACEDTGGSERDRTQPGRGRRRPVTSRDTRDVRDRRKITMTAVYQTSDVCLAERRRYWCDALSRTFVPVEVRESAERRFFGKLASNWLGQALVSELLGPGLRCVRTDDTIRSRGGRSLLQVGLLLAGRADVTQDGRTARLSPGLGDLRDQQELSLVVPGDRPGPYDRDLPVLRLRVRRHNAGISPRGTCPAAERPARPPATYLRELRDKWRRPMATYPPGWVTPQPIWSPRRCSRTSPSQTPRPPRDWDAVPEGGLLHRRQPR